ncbi:MAG: pseudouridine synthase [Candidatus Obscuribacterales bacterium]|nr:pseudouridine synthase [Candidatus Obscuribacterales bacterium]
MTSFKGASAFKPRSDRDYIALNKPFNVLSQFTQSDPTQKRTLAEFSLPKDVYPVGRLDYDSEGLLIVSNDAALNSALLNPANRHFRTYLAQVERIPDEQAIQQLITGVVLDGTKTLPARARLLENEPPLHEREVPIRFRKSVPTCWLELSLTEGRNRQVRRMTAAVGHPTLRLFRKSIGTVNLFDLDIAPGHWRRLSLEQVLDLFGSQSSRQR